MRKLLLLAAMAAVALGASAGYTLEKVWEYTNIGDITPANCRQGLGMNGKFYINDRTTSTITIYDQTGPIGTLPGSPNMTIGRDEAGNIVMSNTAFPNNWGVESEITVLNPTTGVSKVYVIPEECGDLGRCDVLGIAKGDLMTNGELYLTTNTSGQNIVKLVIEDGKVNTDESYAPVCTGVSPVTTNPIYAYTDVAGNDALLFNNRTANPIKLLPDGDGYAGTAISLPNRGTTMGLQPFVWKGHEFFLYNYKTTGYVDYLDGVAVAMNYDAKPRAYVPATVTVAGNANQINWLWAEPGENEVTIYQYYPGTGGHLTVYRMVEVEDPDVYMLGGDDQLWDPTKGTQFTYDPNKDNYTATVTFPAEFNFFGFTTELAENNDDGGWAYIEPFRFGAVAEEGTDYWYDDEQEGQPIQLTWDEYHAIRIAGGTYKLTVDLDFMTLVIEKVPALRGDVDGNGNVGMDDLTALISYLVHGSEINMANTVICDTLDSTTVSMDDLTALINFLVYSHWD